MTVERNILINKRTRLVVTFEHSACRVLGTYESEEKQFTLDGDDYDNIPLMEQIYDLVVKHLERMQQK